MFITALQNVIRRELFRGSMHRGKYRFVRPIKLKEMNLLREEYLREDRVTKLLLNPYLTKVIDKIRYFFAFHSNPLTITHRFQHIFT